MFLLFLALASANLFTDEYGVMYSSNNKKELTSTPDILISYKIPRETEVIHGKNSNDYAFFRCRNNIKSIIFEEESNLHTLQPYSFYKCILLDKINLSKCLNLTIISKDAFSGCVDLSEITFPPNLDTLCSGSFFLCKSITRVFFPSSLRVIQDWSDSAVFERCSNLQSVAWGKNPKIEYLGSNCFYGTALTEIFIPASVTYIGVGPFSKTKLSKLDVDENNKVFSSNGFLLMDKNHTTVYLSVIMRDGVNILSIPEGVQSLHTQALRGINFDTVELPSTLNTIHGGCFYESLILSISLTSNIHSIGNDLFSYCTKLENVTLQITSKIIPEQMFYECSKLQEIIIPDGTIELSKSVFYGCTTIKHIFIPSSVKTIGSGCFFSINYSAIIEFGNESEMKYENRIIYSSDFKKLISYLGDERKIIEIINNVTVIGSMSFKGFPIEGVDFGGSSVTTIEESAFESTNLQNIILPSTLMTLGKKSFFNCTSLGSVEFTGDLIQIIKEYCFCMTNVSTIKITSNIVTVEKFCFCRCKKLKNVEIESSFLTSIGEGCFKESAIKSIVLPRTVDNIGIDCFYGSDLTSLTIIGQRNMKTLLRSAFRGSIKLEMLQIGEGIEIFDESSFEGCVSLKEIRIPSSVHTISSYTFKDCQSLNKVILEEESKLSTIKELAFDGCKLLTTFEISENNQNFKSENGILYDKNKDNIILYFPGNQNVEYKVPESILEIKAHSFRNAIYLEILNIPKGKIQSIGYMAFNGCINLKQIYIPGNLEIVGTEAFGGCSSLKCNSIISDDLENIIDKLRQGSIPEESLHKCTTKVFTISYENNISQILSYSLCSFSKSDDDDENFPGYQSQAREIRKANCPIDRADE